MNKFQMCKIIYNLIKIRQPEKRSRNELLAFLVHLIQRVVIVIADE